MINRKYRKYLFVLVFIVAAFLALRARSAGQADEEPFSTAVPLLSSGYEETEAEFTSGYTETEPESADNILPTLSTETDPLTETALTEPEEAESTSAAEETSEAAAQTETSADETVESAPAIREDGRYTSKEDVALYIHTYGHLPSNYITKKKAQEKGWVGGSLEEFCPGMSIGGSGFGNNEGMLPKAKGRKYYECDIDYDGKRRNAKRIVYSNDGLIFYTEDHYETFEQLY